MTGAARDAATIATGITATTRTATVMLLAAGRGERMRPATDRVPKPLLPVAGVPLIEWQVRRFAAAGFRRFVINVHWLGAQIERHLGDGSRLGVAIEYSREARLLDTGGALSHARARLGDAPFVLASADSWADWPLASLPRTLGDGVAAYLLLGPRPPAITRGDFAFAEPGARAGALRRDPEAGHAWIRLAVIDPHLLDGQPAGAWPLMRALEAAARAGTLHGGWADTYWEDAGTPGAFAALDAWMRQHPERLPGPLAAGGG